ncbi:MAG: hypothetical protein IJJ82_05835 [Clostridia bacterium]|nr:hypothetical protein [Clostridia bacterium]
MEQKNKLTKMEELDARIEKISFDLLGLESRKKEMEDNKFQKQKEIDSLTEEKNKILEKTNKMSRFQKIIYIIIASRTDLKQVDLINTKITENQKQKDNIQNKIDIQNNLYAETLQEKDNYIKQRKELYLSETMTKSSENEKTTEQQNGKVSEIKGLTQIYEIAKSFKDNKIMHELSQIVEKQINEYIGLNQSKEKIQPKEEQEEME